MKFELLATSGGARRGRLALAHGVVETPVFMPVGTAGTVKSVTPDEVKALGAQIVLGNTFHLWLRPGLEVVSAFGTVGFSLGITAQLGTASKAILILVMSIGRLGPLTVFYALSQRRKSQTLHYPEENLMIG
jgi:tRNA-guanine family transglycosylase